jgi:MFS family permease
VPSLLIHLGLFPGLVYYLTFWYRTDERSIRVAFILASATLAGAFGGAIAYGVGHMNGTHGLSAWRWLFILEGIPSCLSSLLVFFFLPDYPESANWLTVGEKALATTRLATEGSHGAGSNLTWAQAKETLTEWRLYAHYAVSCLSETGRVSIVDPSCRFTSEFQPPFPASLCSPQVLPPVSGTKD